MDQQQALTLEYFINNWNTEFPDYELTAADLKKPHSVMGALFQVFKRLGIDEESIVAPPEENQNANMIYYWDLLPVINMVRVFNHVMPQIATIMVILQPTANRSRSILLLLFNLMLFNEGRMRSIAPYEEELFAKTDQIKSLEERKNKLLEMLNEQAEEKGKRAENLDKLDHIIKQYEEDLKQEKEVHNEEIQELESIQKEVQQTEMVLEQKKSVRDALMEEVAKKKALRVYDVDDLEAKVKKAKQDVHEAQEQLYSLQATLMEKETILKNLHTIQPNFDTTNNLLREIMELSDNLKDNDAGDLESDSREGELYVLSTEVNELQAKLSEIEALRADEVKKILESQTKRQQERTVIQSSVLEAEEKDKILPDQYKKAIQQTKEIKEAIAQFEVQKKDGFEQLAAIKDNFCSELKAAEETLLNKAVVVAKKIEEKLQNINI